MRTLRDVSAPAPVLDRPSAAIARNAVHLVMGQGGSMALSVLLNAALGRALGATNFGLLYLVATMTVFAYTFAEWGQGMYVVREVARKPARSGELLGSALALRVLGAAVVSGPAMLLAWAIGYDRRTLLLYAGMLLAYLPLSLVQGHGVVFRGRERMDLDALATVLSKGLVLSAVVAALLAHGGFAPILAAQGMGAAAALVVAAVLARRSLGVSRSRPSLAAMRAMLVGGAPIVAMNLAQSLQAYLETILLAKLAPPPVIGWYAAARTFMNAVVTPAAILAAASFPRLSRAAGHPPQLRRELETAVRPLLAIGALASVGTYLFADLAVRAVYGAALFGPAATVVRVFAPALLLFFVDILLGHACVAAGRARAFAGAKLVAVVLSTGLGVLAVPWFQARAGNGAIGVVVAFAASELVMIVSALALLPRGALARRVVLDVARAIAAGVATLVVMRLVPELTSFVRVPLAVGVFAAAAVGVRLVTVAELASAVSRIRATPPG